MEEYHVVVVVAVVVVVLVVEVVVVVVVLVVVVVVVVVARITSALVCEVLYMPELILHVIFHHHVPRPKLVTFNFEGVLFSVLLLVL
jgi:hypothetical protein